MATSLTPVFPDSDAEKSLYRRLLDQDPTATLDLAQAYLEPLVHWLCVRNRNLDPHLCAEAADRAILDLLHKLHKYQPEKLRPGAYLRMAAHRDLKNLLRREQKHHKQRIPWSHVELRPDAGKYLGRENDPALSLLLDEQAAMGAIPSAVQDRLSPVEAQVLDLMLRGERKTAVYAAACGLADVPAAEQKKRVKQIKDRLKKRLQRARADHEPAPATTGPAR